MAGYGSTAVWEGNGVGIRELDKACICWTTITWLELGRLNRAGNNRPSPCLLERTRTETVESFDLVSATKYIMSGLM